MKVGPLLGVWGMGEKWWVVLWGGAAAVVGGLIGLQQSNIVPVLAYSSVLGRGWILVGCRHRLRAAVVFLGGYGACL